MAENRARCHARYMQPMMLLAQALLAYTFRNVNATDEWSEWFWHSFRARRSY